MLPLRLRRVRCRSYRFASDSLIDQVGDFRGLGQNVRLESFAQRAAKPVVDRDVEALLATMDDVCQAASRRKAA